MPRRVRVGIIKGFEGVAGSVEDSHAGFLTSSPFSFLVAFLMASHRLGVGNEAFSLSADGREGGDAYWNDRGTIMVKAGW